MAPKGSSLKPSAILADAANAFTKAASLAVATAEEQAKLEVVQVQTELSELRREREKNLEKLNRTQLYEKDWEHHADMLKTSLEKSEMTIKHQAETITQLRSEISQWKNQLMRLQESSGRELQDWKEQYQRAEQDRSRLSARVDELVAEQLQTMPKVPTFRASEVTDLQRPTSAIRKPRPIFPVDSDELDLPPLNPKAKFTTKPNNAADRERTYVEPVATKDPLHSVKVRTPRAKPYVELLPIGNRSPQKPTNKLPAQKRSVARADHHTPEQPQHKVIRRVHAVIEVPVKEEEYSDDEALASEHEAQQTRAPIRPRRKSSMKAKSYIESDEDSSGSNGDDDDQLLIGAEDDPDEIYGTQRVIVAAEVKAAQRPPIPMKHSSDQLSTKKRKFDGDLTSVGRIAPAKAARKKQ